jgi:hypothetical protein
MDRHSGNGVGRRDKKDGSGKGNWGNYKDDVNEKDVKEDNENGEPVKAVEDNSLTYEEYLSKKATRVTKEE